MQSDWEAWQKRDLAGDDIVRLILDDTVVRVRLDRRRPAFRCWWRWAFARLAGPDFMIEIEAVAVVNS